MEFFETIVFCMSFNAFPLLLLLLRADYNRLPNHKN